MSDLGALALGDFARGLGETWQAAAGGGAVPLTLTAAEQLGAARREGGAFRLIFRGPPDPLLPQAIYELSRHGDTLEIFIVPIARDAGGTDYEAIFT